MSTLIKRFYDDKIWALKYRPKNIEELILPPKMINQLNAILDSGDIPNMLLNGRAGIGKTSMAFVISEIGKRDFIYINGSEETSIDVIRNKVKQFISSMSMFGDKKIVIIDEMDRLSPQAQDSLKSIIEEFSKTSSFIFTTNHKNRIIAPLISRLQIIDFIFSKEEMDSLMKKFFRKLKTILDAEDVVYDQKVVAKITKSMFPDMRRTLNELQKLSQQGLLDKEEYADRISDLDEYFEIIKSKNFGTMRQYITKVDVNNFYTGVFETFTNHVASSSIADAVLLMGRYSYEVSFCVDPQINLASFSCEMMGLEFK